MAEDAFTEGQFEDLGSYEPKYVKAFKAGAPKDPLGLRSSLKMWWFGWVFMLFSCASCGEQSQFIPYVPVNFQIDLNLPAYNTLNFPGEAIALPGGSKGLYIYRFTLDEFVVLDRHATFDIPLGCQVTLQRERMAHARRNGDEWSGDTAIAPLPHFLEWLNTEHLQLKDKAPRKAKAQKTPPSWQGFFAFRWREISNGRLRL